MRPIMIYEMSPSPWRGNYINKSCATTTLCIVNSLLDVTLAQVHGSLVPHITCTWEDQPKIGSVFGQVYCRGYKVCTLAAQESR